MVHGHDNAELQSALGVVCLLRTQCTELRTRLDDTLKECQTLETAGTLLVKDQTAVANRQRELKDIEQKRAALQTRCDEGRVMVTQMQQEFDEFDGQVAPRLLAERANLRQQLEELDDLHQEFEEHQELSTREVSHKVIVPTVTEMLVELRRERQCLAEVVLHHAEEAEELRENVSDRESHVGMLRADLAEVEVKLARATEWLAETKEVSEKRLESLDAKFDGLDQEWEALETDMWGEREHSVSPNGSSEHVHGHVELQRSHPDIGPLPTSCVVHRMSSDSAKLSDSAKRDECALIAKRERLTERVKELKLRIKEQRAECRSLMAGLHAAKERMKNNDNCCSVQCAWTFMGLASSCQILCCAEVAGNRIRVTRVMIGSVDGFIASATDLCADRHQRCRGRSHRASRHEHPRVLRQTLSTSQAVAHRRSD